MSVAVEQAALSKEEKRRLKKDKKAKAAEQAKENDDVEPKKRKNVDADDADSKEERKRRKKEKKERKEREKALAEHPQDAAQPVAAVISSQAPSPQPVGEPDADSAPADKPSKKRKRKQKEDATNEPTEAVNAEAEDTTAESKAERKRRRKEKKALQQTQPSESTATPTSVDPSSTSPSTQPSSPSDISTYLTTNAITTSAPITPLLSFSTLLSHPNFPSGLAPAFETFKEPTPIQACAWPPALEGKDVVGIAETGSGKTLAFSIPALLRLSSPSTSKYKSSSSIRALVLAPTRELAIQTHDTLSALGKPLGLGSVCLYGGVDKESQKKLLAKKGGKSSKDGVPTAIAVGTPGRIIDLVNEGVCDLSGVDYLVLDEADRMLDKGFENDIRKIIGYTVQGEGRQTLMFSATWPEAVRRLASTFQRDPVRVTVGSDDLSANSLVEQIIEVFDDVREKDARLKKHLRALLPSPNKKSSATEMPRILVFALYKKEAARVESTLSSLGYASASIHGDLSQPARIAALNSFKSGERTVLVATDVAARGLDIPSVHTVINYTFPLTVEDYVHRIGRTGRGGKSGRSVTFFTGEAHERALAGEFAKLLRESGVETGPLAERFPMTIRKKTHAAYGAFFREDVGDVKATKMRFD